jgi:hypothetical protein
VAPTSRSTVSGAPPHNRASVVNAAAASALPPPSPASIGMALWMAITVSRRGTRTTERFPQSRRGLPDEVVLVERDSGCAASQLHRSTTLLEGERIVKLDRL